MINDEDLGIREDGGVSMGTIYLDSDGNDVEYICYNPNLKQELIRSRIHKMLDSAAGTLDWDKYFELIERLHNLT